MSFTAYYELLPQGVQAFSRLGFSNSYFGIELSLAKLAGVAALLIRFVSPRLKEWAYAGFAFNLISAWIAHFSSRDTPLSFVPSTITGLLWASSYYCGASEANDKHHELCHADRQRVAFSSLLLNRATHTVIGE